MSFKFKSNKRESGDVSNCRRGLVPLHVGLEALSGQQKLGRVLIHVVGVVQVAVVPVGGVVVVFAVPPAIEVRLNFNEGIKIHN